MFHANSYAILNLAFQKINFQKACEKVTNMYMPVMQLAWIWFHSSTFAETKYYGRSYENMMEPTPAHVIEKLANIKGKAIPVNYTGQAIDVLDLFYLLE